MLKLNAYQLKLIAIIGMISSHIVIAWWEIIPTWLAFPMYIAGGMTFPIMSYFVAQGYKHTSNYKKYVSRVLLFGLLALPFHVLTITLPMAGMTFSYPFLNIMFNIAVGLWVLRLYERMKSRVLFWLLFVVVIAPLSLVLLEWYIVGVAMVLMGHIIKNETLARIVPSLFAAACFALLGLWVAGMTTQTGSAQFLAYTNTLPLLMNYEFVPVQQSFAIGMVIAAFLLAGYTGERGKQSKWLFYIVYPGHFVVLWLGMLLIG